MTAQLWHGFPLLELRSAALTVGVVPALGAKIVSLFDHAAQHEWLAPPSKPVRTRTIGDAFTDHDLAGWDEMFPTIDACPSPLNPFVLLPDHGEVWQRAWEVRAHSEVELTLRLRVACLPCTLTRTLRLDGQGLHLHYTLANLSDEPLPFLWAAHPLFNANAHTRIVLPDHVTQVINVAAHPVLGEPNVPLSWPSALLPTGETKRLDHVADASKRDYRKVYVPPAVTVGSASLLQTDLNRRLTLRWDASVVPYLGIWVDEGTYTQQTTVALEPATGYYDALNRATQLGHVSTVAPNATLNWWMLVVVEEVPPSS